MISIVNNFTVPCPKPEMVEPRICDQTIELPSFTSLFSDYSSSVSSGSSSDYSSSPSPSLSYEPTKPKAPRNRVNSQQFGCLKQVFNVTAFPSTHLRKELSHKLNMSPRSIQIWFQNRRQSLKGQFPTEHRYHSRFISHI